MHIVLMNDLQLLKLNENDGILLIRNEIFCLINSFIILMNFLNDMQLFVLNESDGIR